MANVLKAESTFEVGERTFTMCIDVNAFCEIEDVLGLDLPGLYSALQRQISLKLVRGMLYGMLHKHHRLTLDQTGELLAELGLDRATELVQELAAKAIPEEDEDEGNGAKPGKKAAAPKKKKAG